MDLSRINMNLFLPFDFFIRERHISRAAKKLNISQSSASKLLGQLREAFKDPILVRTTVGMVPTERALQLHAEISNILKQLENILVINQGFSPQHTNRLVRIGMPSGIAEVILPSLYKVLQKQMPLVQLDVTSIDNKTLQTKIENNEIELAITYANQLPESCKSTFLYKEQPVCLARKNHPLMKKKEVELNDYTKYEHAILVYDELSSQPLGDRLLKQHGIQARNIKLRVRSPLSALPVIATSEMLFTMGKMFCDRYGKSFGLEYRPFCKKTVNLTTHLVWSPVYDTSPWHQFLRNTLKKMTQGW